MENTNKSVQLKLFDNSDFEVGRSVVVRTLWYFANIIFFKSSWFPVIGFKVFMLKIFGAKLGKEIVIKPAVNIKYPWKLSIGDYSWIGENVWIDNLDSVVIGENCCISLGALILSGNHDFNSQTFDLITKPIILENGVWIGAKALIPPGTVAKSHSLLAVNSVAPAIMEPYTIYRGNPAIAVKKRIIR